MSFGTPGCCWTAASAHQGFIVRNDLLQNFDSRPCERTESPLAICHFSLPALGEIGQQPFIILKIMDDRLRPRAFQGAQKSDPILFRKLNGVASKPRYVLFPKDPFALEQPFTLDTAYILY